MMALLLAWTALAAEPPGNLRGLELAVTAADGRRAELSAKVRKEAGFSSDIRARNLFEDALFAYMLEDWDRAAMGFQVLVNLGTTDGPLLSDSEWYLADSLYELGFVEMAAAEFLTVANDRSHPFRDDALRRLVLLYAEYGPPEAFQQTYEWALREQRIHVDTELTYTLGKAWYALGDRAAASRSFGQVPEGSEAYARAQYWMGVNALRDGDLAQAERRFRGVAELRPDAEDERWAVDLARLAVARVLFERREFAESAAWYQRVPDGSPVIEQAREEVAWAWLGAGEHLGALDSLERFRRLQPLHPDVGRTRLLTGHVYFQQGLLAQAETAYEDVSVELSAIRQRVEGLDLEAEQTKALLSDLDRYEPSEQLPQRWALERVAQLSGVDESLAAERELARQREELDACAELVIELSSILDASTTIGRYQQYRRQADAQSDALFDLALVGIGLELDRLNRVRGVPRSRVEQLRDRGDALAGRVQRAAGDREAWRSEAPGIRDERRESAEERAAQRAELRALRAGLATERSGEGGVDWARFDAVQGEIAASLDGMAAIRERVGVEEDAARAPIETVLATEIERLAMIERDHAITTERAVVLWRALGAAGVAEVAEWLRSAERDAGAGLADIEWNRLMDLGDERESTEKAAQRRADQIEATYEIMRLRLR